MVRGLRTPQAEDDASAVAYHRRGSNLIRRHLHPRRESMSIVAWIVLGLIAGAIAKALMPGNDPGGFIVTILIGIVGAFVGGFAGNAIAGRGLSGFSVWSIILAILGAMLLLFIYRMVTRGRAPRV